MQGGIHPDLPGTAYFDLAREVKAAPPGMHVHAFSPMEVVNGAARTGLSVRDWLTAATRPGVDTIPGTAAEILDDEVRWVLTKGKLPAATWVEVITTAHQLGLRVQRDDDVRPRRHPAHWLATCGCWPRIQDETGGFTEFVPLPFVHPNAPVYLAGVARPGPTIRENRAVHAMARLLLHGRIDHVQTSWVKLGVDGTHAMLRGGADDLGGTLMEETISRMAGSDNGSAKTVAELEQMVAGHRPHAPPADHRVRRADRRARRDRPPVRRHRLRGDRPLAQDPADLIAARSAPPLARQGARADVACSQSTSGWASV